MRNASRSFLDEALQVIMSETQGNRLHHMLFNIIF